MMVMMMMMLMMMMMFFFPGGDSCKQAGVYMRDGLQASNENNWTQGLRSTEKKTSLTTTQVDETLMKPLLLLLSLLLSS